MKYFDLEFETEKSGEDVRREMLASCTSELAANAYTLTSQSDIGITYSRKYRPWYIIALAILLFPIGLLFLLATDEATITATVDRNDESGKSILSIKGSAPKNVRQGFEAMQI